MQTKEINPKKKRIRNILISGVVAIVSFIAISIFPVSWLDRTIVKQVVIKKAYIYPKETQAVIINGQRFIQTQVFFTEQIEQQNFSFKIYKDSLQIEENVFLSEEYFVNSKLLKAIIFKDSIYSLNKAHLVYYSNGVIKLFPG